MNTAEHPQRVPVMILTEFLKWRNGTFWRDRDGGLRKPVVRDTQALTQALHPASLRRCLPAGQPHISHDDAREVATIFKEVAPKSLSYWLKDVQSPGYDEGENVLIIAAAARRTMKNTP